MLETYNPILGQQKLSRWDFLYGSPGPNRSEALVFLRDGQVQNVLMLGLATNLGRFWSYTYDAMYRVDVSEHPLLFEYTLPSDNPACSFTADVQIVCRVATPAIIVQRQITDVGALLQPLVAHLLRLISRSYAIQKQPAAEQMMCTMLRNSSNLAGFEIRDCAVRLDVDAEEREHVRQLRHFDRLLQLGEQEHSYLTRRAILDGERAKKSVAFYADLAKQGYDRLLLMYLMYHPEELRTVTSWLNEQRLKDREYQSPTASSPGASAAAGVAALPPPPSAPGASPAGTVVPPSPPSVVPASGRPVPLSQQVIGAQPTPAAPVITPPSAQLASADEQARAVGEPTVPTKST